MVHSSLINMIKCDHTEKITENQFDLEWEEGIHNQHDIRIVKVFTVLLIMTKVGAAFLLFTSTTNKEKYGTTYNWVVYASCLFDHNQKQERAHKAQF